MTTAETRLPPPDHHRDVSGGWLRPAVFGVTDGLVSNSALIIGVAASGASNHNVVLAGLSGLIAGAFSMATGEYVSVASQEELTLAEIEMEKTELRRSPRMEENELAQLYVDRGVDPDTAREVSRQLSANPEEAWRVHVREELGVDPDDRPSPWTAAFSSFFSFLLGAFVPLLPYLLGASNLAATAVLTGAALFAAGAVVSRFTTRNWLYAGARQLVLGGAAAGVTYAIGTALGA